MCMSAWVKNMREENGLRPPVFSQLRNSIRYNLSVFFIFTSLVTVQLNQSNVMIELFYLHVNHTSYIFPPCCDALSQKSCTGSCCNTQTSSQHHSSQYLPNQSFQTASMGFQRALQHVVKWKDISVSARMLSLCCSAFVKQKCPINILVLNWWACQS